MPRPSSRALARLIASARSARSSHPLLAVGGRTSSALSSSFGHIQTSSLGGVTSRLQSAQHASRRYASSDANPGSMTDPRITQSDELVEQAGQALEDGDIEGAKKLYEESLEAQENPTAWFNLGVCQYHLKQISEAITSWQKSIDLAPSADAHTNLASAYILSQPPQPAQAIKHLTSALELSPEDPEIAFNLGAVLESTNNLEHALQLYTRAEAGGIDRAKQNIRNISAKIMAGKAKAAQASASAGAGAHGNSASEAS